MSNKEIIHIDNIDDEFLKLEKRIRSLNNKFLAVALDYKSYIDINLKQDEIYSLRDNILYRLLSAKFHVDIIFSITVNSDRLLTEMYRKSTDARQQIGMHLRFDDITKEISALFDSTIYHLSSVFDYTSNLTEFIIGGKKKTELSWMKLLRSIRDKKNPYSKICIVDTYERLDNEFVGKLYDHRSYLIHTKGEISNSTLTTEMKSAKCKTVFFAPKKFCQKFKELRDMNKEYKITIQYVLFWLLNKSIDVVTELLFALKKYMEENKNYDHGFFIIKGPDGEILPPSGQFWHDNIED